VLLLAAAGSVLLGTLYPLFLDALNLGKISVGPPYFETVFVPIMTPLVFLMGVGPLARWREASLPDLAVRVKWAAVVSLITAALMPFVFGQWTPLVSLGLLCAFWIVFTLALNIWERVGRTHRNLLQRLASQPRGYHAMLLAHLGVAVFIVGVTLVNGYETERDVRMNVGDTVMVGGRTFTFDGVHDVAGPNYQAVRGTVRVSRDGRPVTTLHPEKRAYHVQEMTMTEAAISTGLTGDLYVALGEPLDGGAWSVRVYHKPFIAWIWAGCLLMAIGGFVGLFDRRYRLAARRETLPAAAAAP